MTVLLAELASPAALLAAIHDLRARGYRRLDARVPFDIEGLDAALDLRGRPIPAFALVGGIVGGAGAYALQWWISARAWPLDVGGRPLHSAPAFVPITFESTVLFAGLATLVGLILRARLGRLWEPLDEVDALASATVDAFWLVLDGRDPRFDPDRSAAHLVAAGATRVVAVDASPGDP